MSEKYKYLIGKTKQEVISILGQEFNFFPADHWSYELYKPGGANRQYCIWIFRRIWLLILKSLLDTGSFKFFYSYDTA